MPKASKRSAFLLMIFLCVPHLTQEDGHANETEPEESTGENKGGGMLDVIGAWVETAIKAIATGFGGGGGRMPEPEPMEPKGKTLYYKDWKTDTMLKGFWAEKHNGKKGKPLVLIVHDWDGRDQFEDDVAMEIARMGYIGFAIDVFGTTGGSPEENMKLVMPFFEDRLFLASRLEQALGFALNHTMKESDDLKVAAIGYCFGGLSVLDMARWNYPLKGVVAFHPSLHTIPSMMPPGSNDTGTNSTEPQDMIVPKIMVHHGYKDSSVPPEQVQAFEMEMNERGADWQVIVHGNAKHGFTVPGAGGLECCAYQPDAARRAWQSMEDFFENDLFAPEYGDIEHD